MRVRRLTIRNFRGIASGVIDFPGHTLLVGGNNAGKSTICEALDLVLGPERLYRKPVVDEHDFFDGRYISPDGAPVQIRIDVVLLGVGDEAERRFNSHLRRWNEATESFVDDTAEGPEAADAPDTMWALPVTFVGQYDREEDDFAGNTFFAHPKPEAADLDDAEEEIGAGLEKFTREHKRLCGFVFLRALRTGSRALSLERGSLLDTVLRLSDDGVSAMWADTLERLRTFTPGIGEITQLQRIRTEIESRMARFVPLASSGSASAFFPSDLTRGNLREVVRLFISAEPTGYLAPFQRLGTGSVNLLVFALLTFIADLKSQNSVIFAMEEPEIALPPHTQRRVTRFVLTEMGQAIVTSHSPYVIEQFEPENIVILNRDLRTHSLAGRPIDTTETKPKAFKSERRQFAEAVLARGVLVVEGSTELGVFAAASSVMERELGPETYWDLDMAGVTVFDARSDSAVPKYGPMFKALGKLAYTFFDHQSKPLSDDVQKKLAHYDKTWESPYAGIEVLLVTEMPAATLRAFLKLASTTLSNYPIECGEPSEGMADGDIRALAQKVLEHRKGDAHGYAAMLVAGASRVEDLPLTIRTILETINAAAGPKSAQAAAGSGGGGTGTPRAAPPGPPVGAA